MSRSDGKGGRPLISRSRPPDTPYLTTRHSCESPLDYSCCQCSCSIPSRHHSTPRPLGTPPPGQPQTTFPSASAGTDSSPTSSLRTPPAGGQLGRPPPPPVIQRRCAESR